MNNLKFWLWLTLTGHPATMRNITILSHFKTPENVFTAKRKDYEKVEGLRLNDIDVFCNKSLDEANRVLDYCANNDIRIINIFDKEFPSRLKFISPAPLVLYVKGQIPNTSKNISISIVGTRDFSAYGANAAEKIAYELAKCGVVVVSGMATGIDSVAHKATLKAGGKTIAVLGGGVDFIYPYENKLLYEEIIASGAVISEFPPKTRPLRENFPIRNRIISGISQGTVIVESGERGGSMITARLALEQGRDVFAVPGMIDSSQSVGTNELIKQGAKLVTTGLDVLEEYADINSYNVVRIEQFGDFSALDGTKDTTYNKIASPSLPYNNLPQGDTKKVYEVLTYEPIHISDISAKANLCASETATALLMLEMEGLVLPLTGGFYKIKN